MSDHEESVPAKRQKMETDEAKEPIDKTNEIDRDGAIDFSEDVTETKSGFTVNSYSDMVSQEELEKLREFKVLDEVKSNDEDDESGEDSFDEKSEGVPEDEIEKMLEEDLPEGYKGAPKPKEKPYVNIQKILLEEKGVNPFEVLPLDWILVRHFSGMPVYMHRTTRVCTLSRPYSLGLGNIRRHEIPISAIPCLSYRKALEEEEKQKERDRKIQEQIDSGSWRNNIDTNTTKHVQTNGLNGTPNDNSEKHSNFSDNKVSNSSEDIVDNNQMDIDKDSENTNEKVANDCDKECSNKESNGAEINSEINNEQSVSENLKATQEGNKAKCPVLLGNKDDGAEDLAAKPVVLPGGIVMPPPRVETVSTSWKTQHLTSEQLNDYCKRLFHFKTVNIKHFTRWADRRKYAKSLKALQFPALPEGSRLITIPATHSENGTKSSKRDWVMNMNGRSYLSVFHEYVRRTLQKQPVYEFQQIENATTPYQATVYIGGMQYGVGRGSSKRIAKNNAARESIHILIPEMRDDRPNTNDQQDFTFFDCVGIEDPRISELCAATCEPSPHAVLRTCLLRNFGANDRHIHTEMKKLEYHKIELTMKVGKHTATVICKNKKMAKQRASQAILQALHPHIRSWGSLLRLYGSKSVKTSKENKMEERQITLLQDKAQHNEPNYAVLEKLRQEMKRLKERDEAVVPIGTLLVKDDLPTHSGSNLNNVDL